MHLSLQTLLFVLERDIQFGDIAARLYREAIPEAHRTTLGIWDAMTKAQERLIKNIRTRSFEKFIFVAHMDNGEDFFQKVLHSPLKLLLASTFVFLYLGFMYIRLEYTIHFCRLTVISLPSVSRI